MFFEKDTIADIRQQLDNLYSKKRSYGVYVAKKKAEISEMVQEVISFILKPSFHIIIVMCLSFPSSLELLYVAPTYSL